MRGFRLVALLGVAWAGFVAGHVLGDFLVTGRGHGDPGWMDRIGPVSVTSVLPAALVLLTAATLRSRGGRMSVMRTASLLAAVQVPLCALVGVLGLDPVHGSLVDPSAWVALGIQILVAVAGAIFLAVFVAGVRIIAAALRRTLPRIVPLPTPRPRTSRLLRRELLVRWRRRAPPLIPAH